MLEIGTEELPAADVDAALAHLSEWFESNVLRANSLNYDGVRVFGTPRRLVVLVDGLHPTGRSTSGEIKGPPESAAFDKQGKPTQAPLGLARKNGVAVTPEALSREALVQERDGGRYVVAQKTTEGAAVVTLFPRLLPAFLRGLKFDKTMRWNDSGVAFSRPIRWLVGLYGASVIPFEYAGVASGNLTRGLRPNGSPEIEIREAGQYLWQSAMHTSCSTRRSARRSSRNRSQKTAGFVGGDAMLDPGVLAEVTNLVEKPTAVLGNFDADYLALPRDVLISAMKKHQRYFPVESRKGGAKSQASKEPPEARPQGLLPNFIAMRNGDKEHLDLVQQGNEHVLGARFADATSSCAKTSSSRWKPIAQSWPG